MLEERSFKLVERAVGRALDMGCARLEFITQHLYGEDRQAGVFRLDGRERRRLHWFASRLFSLRKYALKI